MYSIRIRYRTHECTLDCVCVCTQNVYPTLVRTVPAHDHQAYVMIELLEQLQYSTVILMHTNTDDSKAFADYFEQLALMKKIAVRQCAIVVATHTTHTNTHTLLTHTTNTNTHTTLPTYYTTNTY